MSSKRLRCVFVRLRKGFIQDWPVSKSLHKAKCSERSSDHEEKEKLMTEKELRRLSRRELLEMLITRTMENERLTEELQQARKELSDRKFIQEHAGSMAEAALQLNGVFEAADRAAKQYLENIRRMAEESGSAK